MVNPIKQMIKIILKTGLLLSVFALGTTYAETKTEEGVNETLAFWEWIGTSGDKAIEAFDAAKKSKEG